MKWYPILQAVMQNEWARWRLLQDVIIDKFVTKIQVVSESNYILYIDFLEGEGLSTRKLSFTIPFVDALKYCKKRDDMIRQNQYTEIKVKVVC